MIAIRLYFLRKALARADLSYSRAVASWHAGHEYAGIKRAAKRYGDINDRIKQLEMRHAASRQ